MNPVRKRKIERGVYFLIVFPTKNTEAKIRPKKKDNTKILCVKNRNSRRMDRLNILINIPMVMEIKKYRSVSFLNDLKFPVNIFFNVIKFS